MLGIYFYLQIAFAVFLLWASSAALYMGRVPCSPRHGDARS